MNANLVHRLEFEATSPLTLEDMNAILVVAEREGFDRQSRVVITGEPREGYYQFSVEACRSESPPSARP